MLLQCAGRACASIAALAALGCELKYATDGSATAAGTDRGRVLTAMDAELIAAVSTSPRSAATLNVAANTAGVAIATPTGSRIFWSDAAFDQALMKGERIERTATMEVYGYE